MQLISLKLMDDEALASVPHGEPTPCQGWRHLVEVRGRPWSTPSLGVASTSLQIFLHPTSVGPPV